MVQQGCIDIAKVVVITTLRKVYEKVGFADLADDLFDDEYFVLQLLDIHKDVIYIIAQKLRHHARTASMCMEAVKQRGSMLQCVPERMMTESMCLEAVQHNCREMVDNHI